MTSTSRAITDKQTTITISSTNTNTQGRQTETDKNNTTYGNIRKIKTTTLNRTIKHQLG